MVNALSVKNVIKQNIKFDLCRQKNYLCISKKNVMPSKRNGKTQTIIHQVSSFQGKVPPQAVDIEHTLIGALLIEQSAYSEVCELIKQESFYDQKMGMIFRAIADLSLKQEPIDALTVVEQLKTNGSLEDVGGEMAVASLTYDVNSAANVEYYARIIAQKHLERELIRFCSDVLNEAYDAESNVDELMQKAEGRLFELSTQNTKRDFVPVMDVIPDVRKKIEQSANQKNGISGLSSGFIGIDEVTAGWQPSDLIIIAARPAMGKTAFVLSMARNIAVDNKNAVGLFSLEMSRVQLGERLLANVCGLDSKKLRTGQLTPDEWNEFEKGSRLLEDAPIYLDDTSGLSIFELSTKARRLVREHDVKIIIIDYLQLMNANGMNYGNREQEVSLISRHLKALAKELNIPIIALSQLNRRVDSRGDNSGTGDRSEAKRPQLSDLRESGAIEQDADIVCFIHRPEYYKIYEDGQGHDLHGVAQFLIEKHRNGAVKDINLRFRPELTRFLNMEDYVNSTINKEFDSKINNPESISASSGIAEDHPF